MTQKFFNIIDEINKYLYKPPDANPENAFDIQTYIRDDESIINGKVLDDSISNQEDQNFQEEEELSEDNDPLICKNYFQIENVDFTPDSAIGNFITNFSTLTEVAYKFGYLAEEVDAIRAAYHEYITKSDKNLEINFLISQDPINIWQFLGQREEFKSLSSIALRFLSTTASETSAERLFSKQNVVVGNSRRHTSNELRDAQCGA